MYKGLIISDLLDFSLAVAMYNGYGKDDIYTLVEQIK